MKKLIIFITAIFGTLGLHAQQAPTFTVTPSEIDALTENVTIVFNVTGSAVEGLTDVYIWAWCPQLSSPSEILLDYDQGSANWGSISENAKLTPVDGSPNKFKLELPMTVDRAGVEYTFNNVAELFGVGDTPGKIKEFGFLLRSQDGSKQTPGDLITKVTLLPLEFEAAYFRTFPSKVSRNDVVSVYLDLSMMDSGEDEKLLVAENITATVVLLDAQDTEIAKAEDQPATITPEQEYKFTFLPERLGDPSETIDLSNVSKCNVFFSGDVNTLDGSSETVKTKTFEFEFQDYE